MIMTTGVSALAIVSKDLENKQSELEIRMKTAMTTAMLKSTRILRRVLETWGDLLSLRLQRKKHQLKLV